MTKPTRPAPPKTLGAAGKKTWTQIHHQLPDDRELEERELLILEQAAQEADLIASLEAARKRDGDQVEGRFGLRNHPAIAELPKHRTVYQRLIQALELPADEEPQTAAQIRARKAARTRWDKKKKASS